MNNPFVTYSVIVGYASFTTRMQLRDARKQMAAYIRHERKFAASPRKHEGSGIREYRGYGFSVGIFA